MNRRYDRQLNKAKLGNYNNLNYLFNCKFKIRQMRNAMKLNERIDRIRSFESIL